MKKYYAAKTGFLLGTHYNCGDPIDLSARQAKAMAPPYGDDVTTETPKKRASTQKTKSGIGTEQAAK